jgi:site-specific DNA-methyltransferase (adenine-specific)
VNRLYYGDNLEVLRDEIASESVDLIYLDPPFNSNANYNVLFKSKSGEGSDAQITAFEDTWHWNNKAETAFDEVMRSGITGASELLRAMRGFLGENDMMAYLAMMAIRLIELHRVLKSTGSLYLHCDPTASHYLKLLLDGVFGKENYVNEIVWKRSDSHNDSGQGATHFGRIHDVIFRYQKSDEAQFNHTYTPLPRSTADKWYRYVEEGTGRRYNKADATAPGGADPKKRNPHYEWNGVTRYWRYSQQRMQELHDTGQLVYSKSGMTYRKRYLDESKGIPVQDWWDDIAMLRGIHGEGERLGYPTQKPLALLERIIAASSNEGDVVLDPFCGCGTALHAAQKLGRKWIGIDVTHLAIHLIEHRLKDAFPGIAFEVHGTPKDLASARDLAARDKHQFELWALAQVDAQAWKGGRKGPDGGIDGIIYFKPDGKRTEKAIVEVKGGGTGVKDIGRLAQVMEREKAPLGVLVTAENPTRAMEADAAAVGRFEDEWGRTYPKLQILTLAELFQGKKPDIPYVDPASIKRAKREDGSAAKQGTLI